MATIVNNNYSSLIQDGAAAHQMPLDKLATLGNPEQLIRAGSALPPDTMNFLRDSLGTAINHGFILSIAFGVVGLGAAFIAGPLRFAVPAPRQDAAQPEPVVSH
ncbi:hypothetical protein D3C85_1514910 [compost metagenome]